MTRSLFRKSLFQKPAPSSACALARCSRARWHTREQVAYHINLDDVDLGHAMISHFRHLRTYFKQLSHTRRQLTSFTSIVSIQRNVNHEVTRKLSSVVCYTDHSKEKLLSAASRRHWTLQFHRLQSFSSSSSGFNDSRQSERNARTLIVAGLSHHTTVVALRECFSKKWDVKNCIIVRDKMTGASLKYGFVELLTAEQAKHALEFYHKIDGKEIRVQIKGGKEFFYKYKIFVGGLLKETSGETLERHFSKFGDVYGCNIVRNEDNSSRGFGYVTYKSQDSVDRALNSRPHCIDNKVVDVEHTPPRRRELTLFVGNLSPKTTDESLKDHFSKYGQLTECNVKTDRQTGQSRGFGYVAFGSQEELDRALNDQPHLIDGVEVRLNDQTSNFDLVVDSLPQNISEESLKKKLCDYFSRYGRVRDCTFIKNSAGGTTAFVSMSSREEISRALAGRPHWIDTIDKLVYTHQKGEVFALIVKGLPKDSTADDLRKIFSKVGNLVYWEVMHDRRYKTNRSLGYGYVKFSTAEEVDRVMEGQPYSINGQEVTIQRRLGRNKETTKN
ncbi:RNA recognition motif domain-containing protein [Ditylenchus destructor]|nr:RNA recognition motif domain-containing protein [Ditylenchus destructor]